MSFPLLKSVADARKSNKVQPIKKILSLPISDRGEGAHRIGETLDTQATVGIIRLQPAVQLRTATLAFIRRDVNPYLLLKAYAVRTFSTYVHV
jgi:hypothetical protein